MRKSAKVSETAVIFEEPEGLGNDGTVQVRPQIANDRLTEVRCGSNRTVSRGGLEDRANYQEDEYPHSVFSRNVQVEVLEKRNRQRRGIGLSQHVDDEPDQECEHRFEYADDADERQADPQNPGIGTDIASKLRHRRRGVRHVLTRSARIERIRCSIFRWLRSFIKSSVSSRSSPRATERINRLIAG